MSNVGWQLKKYRKESGLSLAELSEMVGLSVSMLSNIERGLRSPTISSLMKICKALNITINELIDAAETKQIVRKDERKQVFAEDHDNTNVSYYSLSEGIHKMNGMCMVVEDVDVLHESFAHKVDEFGIVIEGKMIMWLDDESFDVNEGDSIYVPAGTNHSFKNVGPRRSVSYWITCSDF